MEELKQKGERVNTKRIFIDCLIEAKDFLQSDIEIIVKNQNVHILKHYI